MKPGIWLVALAATLAVLPARGAIEVVATLPDYAAIARDIGGRHVTVSSLAKGSEDAHFVDARPSFIRVLNKADLLLEGGADLEIGWLPALLGSARNNRIIGDRPGHVVLSRGVHLLDVPAEPVDRSMGDVHPLGNPHYWLDPVNGKVMAETIAQALVAIDPEHRSDYEANLERFQRKLDSKLAEWQKRLAPFKGTKVITYHKSFDYLLERFGLVLVGTIEPRPGIEPSPHHISSLVSRTRAEGVKLVLIEPFRPRKTPERVAESIGAQLLVLPDKVSGNEHVKDYLGLFDYNVSQIAAALEKSK